MDVSWSWLELSWLWTCDCVEIKVSGRKCAFPPPGLEPVSLIPVALMDGPVLNVRQRKLGTNIMQNSLNRRLWQKICTVYRRRSILSILFCVFKVTSYKFQRLFPKHFNNMCLLKDMYSSTVCSMVCLRGGGGNLQYHSIEREEPGPCFQRHFELEVLKAGLQSIVNHVANLSRLRIVLAVLQQAEEC